MAESEKLPEWRKNKYVIVNRDFYLLAALFRTLQSFKFYDLMLFCIRKCGHDSMIEQFTVNIR
jgi:hypothetical protein